MQGGRFVLEHSGEVSGFVAENMVFPDDSVAIVVLTNQDASSAASTIRVWTYEMPDRRLEQCQVAPIG